MAAASDCAAEDAPRLSVIVPVYNSESLVRDCLAVLRSQSVSGLEAVFVDDCSTDGTVAAIQQAAAGDPRFVLLRQPCNQGPGAARNAGIARARGRYIAFLDVDDRYGSDGFLETLCDAAERSGLPVAGACFANEHARGRMERRFPQDGLFWGYSLDAEGPVPYDLYQFDYGFHRFVFHRSLFEGGANRFPDLRYFEDPVFLVRILHQARAFCAVPGEEYLYRCDFSKQNWTTQKALDFLEGVRCNLAFSRSEGLARLHWVTAARLDWEYGKIGVGVRGGLDIGAISAALERAEAEVDERLLAEGGPVPLPFRFAMRDELDSLPQRSWVRSLVEGAKYRLLNGAVWHYIRPYVKG